MSQKHCDLTDAQYEVIKEVLQDQRKRKYDLRMVWSGIFYLLKTGCQWRCLPDRYPPWELVYYYFNKWKQEGLIEELQDRLVERERKLKGREPSPSVGIMDSKSVSSTCLGMGRGYDAGKKVKGIKRHIVVDSLGLILAIYIHTADIQDRDGAKLVLPKLLYKFPRLKVIFADGGYSGQLIDWVGKTYGWLLTIIKRTDTEKVFKVLPKRWIVERTFSWLDNHRRLSKDFERLNSTAVAVGQLAMIYILLKRIKK